ncbi:hypothetical protein SAMN04488518_109242 [Pseudovibrio ascidiaceicola]|uniref:RiboL-PSP-HEPN domain-containing protein n=1 Tax=Pseudovibrio ascidiaceicola TaxID=285279 RepID=A0A1I4CNA6_9HYPH|nr:hypothetical protein [Pseudovibrio ascidiaceicola]SFK82130.1 hypothetical protein SAMN04488518_109242 [Pseudovibrio ascidiaceicola]
MSSDLKQDDLIVCVHTIDGIEKDKEKRKYNQPDVRCNKPTAIYIEDDNKTAFFQKMKLATIGTNELGFVTPNEIALSLNIARKSNLAAIELRRKIRIPAKGEYLIEQDDIVAVYDLLEEIQKSILFAYKAVEAFCNSSIPDTYVYSKEKSKGVVEKYGKAEIERKLPTTEKLSSILPDCLGVDKPTSQKFWSDFKNLERLRNEITHSKSSSRAEVTAELLSDKVDRYIKSAVKLLEYFVSTDVYNPIFPMGFGLSKIQTTAIKCMDDHFRALVT